MRVAVVYFAERHRKYLEKLSKAVAKGIEKQNASVDVFAAKEFTARFSAYDLVVVGTESAGTFGGKLPEGMAKFVVNSGPAMNLKSVAFVAKKGLRCRKSLQVLMSTMEKEGMFVIYSDVFDSPKFAEETGEKLVIQK